MPQHPKPIPPKIDRSINVTQEPEIAFVQSMLMANIIAGRYSDPSRLIQISVHEGIAAGEYYRKQTGKPPLERFKQPTPPKPEAPSDDQEASNASQAGTSAAN